MTDRAQFEAMLEALVNNDQAAAKEIFHNIVVSKSREIYEELLAEDFDLSEKAEEEEEEESVEEAFGEEEEESSFGDEEGEEGEEEEEEEESSFGDEEGEEEGDLKDRVLDLEDALEELQADFDQLMAGEEEEPEHNDMFGGDEFGGNEFGGDEFGGNEFGQEEPVDELSAMLEYVNKVSLPKHGDNGVNTKSTFNKPKYNDMGGTAPKFGQEAKGEGSKGGLLNPSTTEENFGNINVPGGKAGNAFSKKEPGHGAEKKGSGEKADNKKSLLGGR